MGAIPHETIFDVANSSDAFSGLCSGKDLFFYNIEKTSIQHYLLASSKEQKEANQLYYNSRECKHFNIYIFYNRCLNLHNPSCFN